MIDMWGGPPSGFDSVSKSKVRGFRRAVN